jgi:hypothetical protein
MGGLLRGGQLSSILLSTSDLWPDKRDGLCWEVNGLITVFVLYHL